MITMEYMKSEQIDTRTALQKERAERNEAIYKLYTELKNKVSEGTSERALYRIIGEQYELAPEGVRAVIKRLEAKMSKESDN